MCVLYKHRTLLEMLLKLMKVSNSTVLRPSRKGHYRALPRPLWGRSMHTSPHYTLIIFKYKTSLLPLVWIFPL